MKRISFAACALFACLGLVGAQDLPVFEPTEKTSYAQVVRYLNPGGHTFLYQSAAEWGKTLETLVPFFRALLLQTVARHDAEETEVVFHFVEAFLKESGLRQLNGVGASSIPIGDGLHHNRVYVGHSEGKAKGLLWDMVPANAPLDLLDALPADTVLAVRIPLRGALAWKWFRDTMATCPNAELREEFQEEVIEEGRGQGFDLDAWFASLGDGAGLVLTVAPRPEGAAKPEGGIEAVAMDLAARSSFAVLVEVKDDTIFSALEALFRKDGEPFARQDMGEIRALVFQGHLPVPDQAFVFARFGKYLAFASNDRVVKALAEGKGGLTETAEFQRLGAKLPREGVGFSFLGKRLGSEVGEVVTALQSEMGVHGRASFMALTMQGLAMAKDQASYGVALRTPDGLLSLSTETMSLFDALFGQILAAPAMLVGRVDQAPGANGRGGRGAVIATVNNLKQVGLGLIMFADDHGEVFPPDLGGIWDYINQGSVFVVRGSGTKPPASAADIRAGQCDLLYLVAGTRMAQMAAPATTPAACTKPGLLQGNQIVVLYADGHVEMHAEIPDSVKALLAKGGKKGAATKQDANYARIRGLKLGAHLATIRPKARILLLMPPTPEGGIDAALLAGLKAGLGEQATVVDTVTLERPKDAKDDGWFTGELLNARTEAFKGKVDLVVSGMGLPAEGIQALWFWPSQVPVALAAGEISRLRRAIQAKLVIAAAAPDPEVIPDDWQPPQDLDAAFAKRYLLVTPENVQALAEKHPKLFE